MPLSLSLVLLAIEEDEKTKASGRDEGGRERERDREIFDINLKTMMILMAEIGERVELLRTLDIVVDIACHLTPPDASSYK
jgi:hypothetical protein